MTALNKNELLAKLGDLGAPTAYELSGVGTVYIKKLSIDEQASLAKDADDNVKASLRLVAYSVCDEDGKRLFGDADLKALGKMHSDTLTELVEIINQVNGFDKKLEELKKD